MNGLTKIRFIREDGTKMDFGGAYNDENEWLITEMQGIDAPTFENFSESEAVSDGSIMTGSHVTGRSIRIKANVKNKSLNDVLRRLAIRFFNQKHSFKLYITYMGVERWIEGIIDGMSIPSGNVYVQQTIDITFFCAKPYFNSVDNFGKNIAAVTPMFAFPYITTFPTEDKYIPVLASYYNLARNVNISNDGDVETFLQVVIRITGNVKNPMITKDETKFVKVLGDYVVGDVINIDMVNLDVTVNGIKSLHKLDKASSFTDCAITPGDNTIGFDADDGHDYMEVNVYYNKLYMGL